MGRTPKQIFTPKQKRRRRGFWILLAILLVPALLMYADVQRSRSLICESAAAAPPRPVAIVFGAAGDILADRVSTGVELYNAGKVKKLLMTGDNGRNGYNEPQTMKDQAIAEGIPAKDIVLDYAGFRTYDSLYRAHAIFGVTSALLVTQRYHLPRALFTARRLGIDDVVGVDAAKRSYVGQWSFDLREIAAVEVAWVQATITHPRPKFLGKPETLFSNSQIPPPKDERLVPNLPATLVTRTVLSSCCFLRSDTSKQGTKAETIGRLTTASTRSL